MITLTFNETSEKVLQTELQVTGPADRFRSLFRCPFEGHLLESGSPLVPFHFVVKEAPSYSCPCMRWSTITFLFYMGPIIHFSKEIVPISTLPDEATRSVTSLKHSDFVSFLRLLILFLLLMYSYKLSS